MRKLSSFLFLAFVALALTAVAALPGAARAQEGHTFRVSIDNVAQFAHASSGVFNTPAGAVAPGPALPGEAYEFSFYAAPGETVSFATMLVQSNDWFFAPAEHGIPVYNADGTANTGDVTGYVALWDAGTEGDQPAGSGVDQAPRQAGPNSGPADPNTAVRQVLADGVPPTSELIRATLTETGPSRFTLRIANVSGDSAAPSPLAPGVFVVGSTPAPLFVNGAPDRGYGLEALAEDGMPGALASALAAHSGINTPLAPAAWLVSQEADALFAPGQAASAGLQALAEDGGPGALLAEQDGRNAGAAAVGRGADGPGPIFAPDGNYTFTFTAVPGDHLSLATMFVQSNDWFYGLNSLPLFDAGGSPVSGDITAAITVYDAGSEVDQAPGYGSNQAPRQAGPNTGPAQGGVVSPLEGMVIGNIHVTITPLP